MKGYWDAYWIIVESAGNADADASLAIFADGGGFFADSLIFNVLGVLWNALAGLSRLWRALAEIS